MERQPFRQHHVLPVTDATSYVFSEVNNSQLLLVMLVCSNTEAKKHQIERHDANNKSQCHGTVLNPVGSKARGIEDTKREADSQGGYTLQEA